MLIDLLKFILNGIQIELLWIVMVVLLGLSLLYCLLGYRYIRIAMGLGSFLFGTLGMIFFLQQTTWPPMTVLIVSVIVGIILLAASIMFYAVDLGILSALTAYLLVVQVLGDFLAVSISPGMIQLIAILTGIITAALTLFFTKPMFILVSSFGGGMLIAQIILQGLIYSVHNAPTWLMWVLTIVCVGIAIYIQFGVSARKILHETPPATIFARVREEAEETAEPETESEGSEE